MKKQKKNIVDRAFQRCASAQSFVHKSVQYFSAWPGFDDTSF